MVKGYHLQLKCCLLVFHDHKWLKIKASFIQKEVDELLAKSAIEPSTGDARFYANILVVHKHTNGLHLIFYLKQFNDNIHIATLKVPTVR